MTTEIDRIPFAGSSYSGNFRCTYFYDKTKSLAQNMESTPSSLGKTLIKLNYDQLSPFTASSKYLSNSLMGLPKNNICEFQLEGFIFVDEFRIRKMYGSNRFEWITYVFREKDVSFQPHDYARVIRETTSKSVQGYTLVIDCHRRLPRCVDVPPHLVDREPCDLHANFYFTVDFICDIFRIDRATFPTDIFFAWFFAFVRDNDVKYVLMHYFPITCRELTPSNMYRFHIKENDDLVFNFYENVTYKKDFHPFRILRRFGEIFYTMKLKKKMRRWAYRAVERLAQTKYSPANLEILLKQADSCPEPEQALMNLVERW